MTDFDRDRIDLQTENVIRTCNQLLQNLKSAVKMEKCSHQLYQHWQLMTEIIDGYLKAVCRIYSEQRAIRVKKASDMKRMSRLETLVRLGRNGGTALRANQTDASGQNRHVDQNCVVDKGLKQDSASDADLKRDNSLANEGLVRPDCADRESVMNGDNADVGLRHRKPDSKKAEQVQGPSESYGATSSYDDAFVDAESDEDFLSPAEKTQLMKENDQLYHKMNSMVDEIQELEGKVVEIGRLQTVFTEKVLQQESDIYRVNDVAIHTTDNLHSANEQIREAMKKKATMRVWILFFLIVLSFTLLFLDWYNN